MAEPSELRNLIAETTTAAEAATEPVQTEKPEVATQVPEKSETTSGERPRGPDGKFLPKDAAQAEEVEQEPPEAEEEEGEAEAAEKAEPEIEFPQHWQQADKDLIAGLPAEHRTKVFDRINTRYREMEAAFTPRLQRGAQLEKQFGGADEIFKPYAEVLRQRGQTPSDVVKIWASVEQGFVEGMRDATEGRPNEKGAVLIANLIRNYRVNPAAVAAILQGGTPAAGEGAAQPNGQIAVPPELLQKINALETREIERENFARQQREAVAQRQIDSFAAEKDAQGNLLRPYFAEVETEINRLAKLDADDGKPIDLADLYDRAAYANRETRAKLLSAKDAEAKRQAAVDRKARAVAAQRAASSVTGSPGSGQSPNEQHKGTRSLRETLEEAAAESDAV